MRSGQRTIFAQHCLSCHDSREQEGSLILETYQTLLKGGDSGAVIVPGKAADSLLVKQIEHAKKPFMPPPKKGEPARRAARMDEEFDAVLYLGPVSAITLAPLSPTRCADVAFMEMRLARMALSQDRRVESTD